MSAVICVICLDSFSQNIENCILPCGHAFHQNCLNNWMQHKHSCPKCQGSVRNEQISRIYLSFQNDVSIIVKLEHNLSVKNAELEEQIVKQNIKISALERNQQPTRTDDNLSGKVLDMAMELGQLKERSKDFDTLKTRFDNSERMVRRLKDDNDRKTDSIAKMTMVHEVKCKEYNDTIANMVAVRDQLKEDFNAKLNLLKERCKDFDILKSKFDNAEKVIKLLEIDNCTKQASIAKMLVDHETKCKEYDETIASMTAERVQLTVDFDAKYNVQKENLQIMTKEVQELKETNNYVNESHRMRGEIDYLEKKLNRKHYNAQQSIADTPVDARNDKVNNGKHKDKEPNERPKRLAKEPSDSKIRLHREHMKWKIKY